MKCPKCGSENVDVSVYQETTGSKTISRTKSKYKEKGHGILWWLCVGWWWWIIDLFLWIYMFFPRFLIRIFKRKKYTGSSKTTETTTNKISYKSVYVCKDCGYNWTD